MSRPGAIDRMPVEVREGLALLRGQGRTIDELRGWLAERGHHVCRATVGKHTAKLDRAPSARHGVPELRQELAAVRSEVAALASEVAALSALVATLSA